MYSLTYLNSVQGCLTEQALNFQQNTPSSPKTSIWLNIIQVLQTENIAVW